MKPPEELVCSCYLSYTMLRVEKNLIIGSGKLFVLRSLLPLGSKLAGFLDKIRLSIENLNFRLRGIVSCILICRSIDRDRLIERMFLVKRKAILGSRLVVNFSVKLIDFRSMKILAKIISIAIIHGDIFTADAAQQLVRMLRI